MRFGWLAAAAAMMCAGQAEAARYYEFQISGATSLFSYDPFGAQPPFPYIRNSSFYVVFDTQNQSQFSYGATGVPDVDSSLRLQDGELLTINRLSSTYFDFSFDPSTISVGQYLRPIALTGSYGYNDCDNRYRVCTKIEGRVFYTAARTSDVLPTNMGERELVTYSAAPEAATWATMILGLGMVGVSLRRRRSTHAGYVTATRL